MTEPEPPDLPTARLEDLPEKERSREVYARYGLTMFYAQGMEATLVNLLLVASFPVDKKTEQDLQDLEDLLTTKTAGHLLRRLRNLGLLTSDEETLCDSAVRRRNFLAHHYWYEHSFDFAIDTGKQAMLDEADQARGMFLEVDAVLTRTLYALGQRYGLTPEAVEAHVEATRPKD